MARLKLVWRLNGIVNHPPEVTVATRKPRSQTTSPKPHQFQENSQVPNAKKINTIGQPINPLANEALLVNKPTKFWLLLSHSINRVDLLTSFHTKIFEQLANFHSYNRRFPVVLIHLFRHVSLKKAIGNAQKNSHKKVTNPKRKPRRKVQLFF